MPGGVRRLRPQALRRLLDAHGQAALAGLGPLDVDDPPRRPGPVRRGWRWNQVRRLVRPEAGLLVVGQPGLVALLVRVDTRPSLAVRATNARMPAGRIRPSFVSRSTLAMLTALQLLPFRRGVKRCATAPRRRSSGSCRSSRRRGPRRPPGPRSPSAARPPSSSSRATAPSRSRGSRRTSRGPLRALEVDRLGASARPSAAIVSRGRRAGPPPPSRAAARRSARGAG